MLNPTPEHILITFAFGEKSKGISKICTHRSRYSTLKKIYLETRSAHFLTTNSHVCTSNHVIDLATVFNQRVYYLKIKLLIQQIQSQHVFLTSETT